MKYDISHEAIAMSYKALEAWHNDLAFRMNEIYKKLEAEGNVLAKEKSIAFFNETIQTMSELRMKLDDLMNIDKQVLPVLTEMEELAKADAVKNFFFTFGDDPNFPFKKEDYVLVRARNINQAAKCFRYFYPNENDPYTLNCADYYSQEDWDMNISKYYSDGDELKHPAVVLDFTEEIDESVKGRPYIRG